MPACAGDRDVTKEAKHVGLFNRRSKGEPTEAVGDEQERTGAPGLADDGQDRPAEGVARGPLDSAAAGDTSGHIDLGALRIRGEQGMQLRLEVDEQAQQVTAVTVMLGDSAVQLQPFAAPRTEGVWVEIRNEIAASIVESGGSAEVITGVFGEELIARMPQQGPDQRTVFVPVRFVGIDGPRWFLRAVVSGRAVVDGSAAAPVNDVIANLVVHRGSEAMPPRELLPITPPAVVDAQAGGEPGAPDSDGADAADPSTADPHLDDLKPFERGPEITEVR